MELIYREGVFPQKKIDATLLTDRLHDCSFRNYPSFFLINLSSIQYFFVPLQRKMLLHALKYMS